MWQHIIWINAQLNLMCVRVTNILVFYSFILICIFLHHAGMSHYVHSGVSYCDIFCVTRGSSALRDLTG